MSAVAAQPSIRIVSRAYLRPRRILSRKLKQLSAHEKCDITSAVNLRDCEIYATMCEAQVWRSERMHAILCVQILCNRFAFYHLIENDQLRTIELVSLLASCTREETWRPMNRKHS